MKGFWKPVLVWFIAMLVFNLVIVIGRLFGVNPSYWEVFWVGTAGVLTMLVIATSDP